MKSTLSGKSAVMLAFAVMRSAKRAVPALAGDPIAGLEAVDLFADRHDNSGCVRARHVRERGPHLITAADHQIVHVADRRSVNVDKHLVVPWTGFRRFADGQRLYSVECTTKHPAHLGLHDLLWNGWKLTDSALLDSQGTSALNPLLLISAAIGCGGW